MPGTVGCRRATAVVADRQHQRGIGVTQHDGRGRHRAGVLARVGEGLLHDPVGGERDTAGQWLRVPFDRERHRQPGQPGLVEQFAEFANARLRGAYLAGPLFLPAQHPEHAPHLGERLAPGGRDGGQGLLGPAWVGGQRVRGAVGLHHHDADVVRDHVVQFPGDPGPLGDGRDPRLGVPLPFQPGGPVLQVRVVGPPVVHRVAQHPGEQRGPGEQDRLGSHPARHVRHVEVGPPDHRNGRADQADGQAPDRDPPGTVRGQGIEQDEDGQVRSDRADAERDLDPAGHDGHRVGTDRVGPPEHHGHREAERHRDEEELAHGHGGPDAGQQQRGSQHAVHQPRVTADPRVQGSHTPTVDRHLPGDVILAGTFRSSPGAMDPLGCTRE